MTEHTITVEETVEKDETVYTCNGCGLEVRDNEIAEYTNGSNSIHLHTECEADLLHTNEPTPDGPGLRERLPRLDIGKYIDPYVAAVRILALFALFPLTFVHIYRVLGRRGNEHPGTDVFFIGIVWVFAFWGLILLLPL